MSERCSNCGAELYAGQQFCRRCGAAVGGVREDAPTQLFPSGTPTSNTPAGTNALGGGTNAVGPSQPTAYHTPLQSFQQTSPLAAQAAPRKRRRGRWLVALLVVFLIGVGAIVGAGYVLWRASQHKMIVKRVGAGDAQPHPPLPPDFPEKIGEQVREALGESGVPLPIDESGASVGGDETVLTESYELDGDATVSVHGVNGDVSVTGWDGDRAELKIVKRGGSADQRRGVPVLLSKSDEGLSFMTAATPGASVSVSYELKLPRNLHQIEISADKGDVKVNGFGGTVVADVKLGSIELRGVTGAVKSKLIKGNTTVVLEGSERQGAQEFSVVKGNIEATIPDGAGADIKAETIDGDIDVDERYGLKVSKSPAARHLAGRLGDGGEPLLFKVTNGDIKLKK